MSVTKPLTKMKKFFKHKDDIVKSLVRMSRGISSESSYTNYRPHKKSLIYIGPPTNEGGMTFCIEMEYQDVLLMFFYEPNVDENIEYSFAFDWTEHEIETGTDMFKIASDIGEGEFFQESLVNDMQFLTYELHKELVRYCFEVYVEVTKACECIESD